MTPSTEVSIRLYEGAPPAPVTPESLHDWVLEQINANRFIVTAYSVQSDRNALDGRVTQAHSVVLEQSK